MSKLEKKNFLSPDESKQPVGKVVIDSVELNGTKILHQTAQEGWRWSVDLKPILKTESCQIDHLLYIISGQMGVRMNDGNELELAAGDMASIPPGHDGWNAGEGALSWLEIPH
jgi:quercetin dioxygenase-like cupin family protein